MVLDVFDLCTPALQKRLMVVREKIKQAEDAKLDRDRAKVMSICSVGVPIEECLLETR